VGACGCVLIIKVSCQLLITEYSVYASVTHKYSQSTSKPKSAVHR
jgi:hypothetical protein